MAEQQVIFDRTKTPFDGRLLVLNSGQIEELLKVSEPIPREKPKHLDKGTYAEVSISKQPFDVLGRKLVVKKKSKQAILVDNSTDPPKRDVVPRAPETSDFTNEIFATRLRHFAIVPVIGIHIGEIETVFLSVALDRDLCSVLNGEQIDGPTKKRVLYQIAAALHFLHTGVDGVRPAIAHGDVTARNVVLDKKNNARLIDFGSCRPCVGDAITKDLEQFREVITELRKTDKTNKDLQKLEKRLKTVESKTMRTFIDEMREMPLDEFVQDESDPSCQVCLLQEADTVPFDDHSCEKRPKICIACLQSSYMNPVVCPECLKPVEVPFPLQGTKFGGILMAGNHVDNGKVDETSSNIYYNDVKDMANIITSNHYHVNSYRGSNVRTIFSKQPQEGDKKLQGVVKMLKKNVENGIKAIEQAEEMLDARSVHGNEHHVQSLKDTMYKCDMGLDRIQEGMRGHLSIDNQIQRAFDDMKRFGVTSLLVYFSGECTDSREFQLSNRSDHLAMEKLKDLIKSVGNMEEMKTVTIMFDCCYPPMGNSVLGDNSNTRFIQINCGSHNSKQELDRELSNSVFTEYVKQILDKKSLKSSNSNCLLQRKFDEPGCTICADQNNLDMTKKYTTVDEFFYYIDRHMKKHYQLLEERHRRKQLLEEDCEENYRPMRTLINLTRHSGNFVHNSHFTYEFPVILHRKKKGSTVFDIHELLDGHSLNTIFRTLFSQYLAVNFNIEMSIPDREQLRLFRLTTVVGDEEIKTKERLLTAFVHKELIQFGFQEIACITKGPIAVFGDIMLEPVDNEDIIIRLDVFESFFLGVPGPLKSCLNQFDQTMYVRIQSGKITERHNGEYRDRKMDVYELLQPTNTASTLMCC